MKKIQFICDKCLKVIDMQITIPGEKEEVHLFPIGNQEWCYSCMNELYPEFLSFGQKLQVMTPEEIEKHVQKI